MLFVSQGTLLCAWTTVLKLFQAQCPCDLSSCFRRCICVLLVVYHSGIRPVCLGEQNESGYWQPFNTPKACRIKDNWFIQHPFYPGEFVFCSEIIPKQPQIWKKNIQTNTEKRRKWIHKGIVAVSLAVWFLMDGALQYIPKRVTIFSKKFLFLRSWGVSRRLIWTQETNPFLELSQRKWTIGVLLYGQAHSTPHTL